MAKKKKKLRIKKRKSDYEKLAEVLMKPSVYVAPKKSEPPPVLTEKQYKALRRVVREFCKEHDVAPRFFYAGVYRHVFGED